MDDEVQATRKGLGGLRKHILGTAQNVGCTIDGQPRSGINSRYDHQSHALILLLLQPPVYPSIRSMPITSCAKAVASVYGGWAPKFFRSMATIAPLPMYPGAS